MHTWMNVKHQINVELTLFFLFNKVVGRQGGVGWGGWG